MHFEYPNWTGDRSTVPPRPRARSNSFTYRNPKREPEIDEEDVPHRTRPGANPWQYPPRTEEYYDMRDYIRMDAMPTFRMQPHAPFTSGVRMSAEQARYERNKALHYEYERQRRQWDEWARTQRVRFPPNEWARRAEWIRREAEATRRYEEQRAREWYYYTWRNTANEYESARSAERLRGYSRTDHGSADEWSRWRRAPPPTWGRGSYTYPHPFPHSHSYSHGGPPRSAHEHSETRSSSAGSSSPDSQFDTLLRDAFVAYDSAWALLLDSSTPLAFRTVPWPQHPPPRSLDDINTRAVRAFLGAGTRTLKSHTREALLRFHPDKIASLLARVTSAAERELVAAACAAVTRCLGELMKI